MPSPVMLKHLKSGKGAELRAVYAAAASRQPVGRSELAARIRKLGIPVELGEAVFDEAQQLARKARGGASPMVLNQLIDRAALAALKQYNLADSLLGEEGVDDRLPGEVDAQEVADGEDLADRIFHHDASEEATQQRRADEAERAKLQRLGYQRRA